MVRVGSSVSRREVGFLLDQPGGMVFLSGIERSRENTPIFERKRRVLDELIHLPKSKKSKKSKKTKKAKKAI